VHLAQIDEALVRERLQNDRDFQRWSKGEVRLLDLFVARSVRFNQLHLEAARASGWRMIHAREMQETSWDDLLPSAFAG